MALSVTHTFVSAIADDPASVTAGQVVPSNWNAVHTLTGTVDPAQITIPYRAALIANTTYFVSTTGSDLTGTGTVSKPWATLAHAWSQMGMVDNGGFTVTIQLANGTYAGLQTGSGGNTVGGPFGGGNVTIQGNTSDASQVVISDANGPFLFNSPLSSVVTIQWLTCTGSNSFGIALEAPGVVVLSGTVNFGTAVNFPIFAFGGGAQISFSSVTVNLVGSPTYNGVLVAAGGGLLQLAGAPSTVNVPSGTVTSTSGMAQAYQTGNISTVSSSLSFTGNFAGSRFAVSLNGVIDVFGSGINFFPGNSAGTTATGGQYAA